MTCAQPNDPRARLLADLAQVGELLDVEVLPRRVLPRRLRDLLAELDAVAELAEARYVAQLVGDGADVAGEIEAAVAPVGTLERVDILHGELRDLWGEWLFVAGALVGWEARSNDGQHATESRVCDAAVLRAMCDAADVIERRDGWDALRRGDL